MHLIINIGSNPYRYRRLPISWPILDVRSDGSDATCPINQPLYIYRVRSFSLTMHARIMASSDVRSDRSDATCPLTSVYIYIGSASFRYRHMHVISSIVDGRSNGSDAKLQSTLLYNVSGPFLSLLSAI